MSKVDTIRAARRDRFRAGLCGVGGCGCPRVTTGVNCERHRELARAYTERWRAERINRAAHAARKETSR